MALYITDQCINCDVCEPECPNDAIYQGELIYEIEAEKCTECVGHFAQEQCIVICPIDCIFIDKSHQENHQQLARKYTQLTGLAFDPEKIEASKLNSDGSYTEKPAAQEMEHGKSNGKLATLNPDDQ